MEFSATPTLRSDRVVLEQLTPEHRDDLAAAVAVDGLWRTWYTHIPSPEQMAGEIERRLSEQQAGRLAPWAIVDATTGRAVEAIAIVMLVYLTTSLSTSLFMNWYNARSAIKER